MVDPDHVIHLHNGAHAVLPPCEIRFFVVSPVIKRISPELTGDRIGIRRTACNRFRLTFTVKLEQLPVCPGIRGIKSHIDWYISDELYAFIIGIFFELVPLSVEKIL